MSLKEDVEKVQKKVEETSLAFDLLKDYKKQNKRQFIIILVILTMWFITGCYLIYILNDIGVTEETTVTQDNSDGYNNYIGNNGDINNGKTNDQKN